MKIFHIMYKCKKVGGNVHNLYRFTVVDSVYMRMTTCRGSSLRRVKNGSKWRAKEIFIEGKPPVYSTIGATTSAMRSSSDNSASDLSPALLAQANWTFVEKLLKVCRKIEPFTLSQSNSKQFFFYHSITTWH